MKRLGTLALLVLIPLLISAYTSYIPMVATNRIPAMTATPVAPTATATQPQSTATPAPTATPHWVELVADGGFEAGTAGPWAEMSQGGYQVIRYGVGLDGSWGAQLCGYNNANDAVYQPIYIPSDAIMGGVALSLYMDTIEYPNYAYDYFQIMLLDTNLNLVAVLAPYNNTMTARSWMYTASEDLTGYRDQHLMLSLGCTNSPLNPTVFFVDNVSFPVQVP